MGSWTCITSSALLIFHFLAFNEATAAENNLPFISKIYKCVNDKCIISGFQNETKEINEINESVDVCRLTCGQHGSLWPRPTIMTTIKNPVVKFGLENIVFNSSSVADEFGKQYMAEASEVLMSSLRTICKPRCVPNDNNLTVFITTTAPFTNIKWSTNESYELNISTDYQITVKITARTVYGARNGLETLRQLITAYGRPKFNGKTLVMAGDVQIVDEPVYAHRGFMLDTSRNYFPLSAIKRTIDAMGHSKLNVFHWHATDSHSFPLDLPSAPQMARYGAYSPEKTYSYKEIKDLLRYALVRGVRIIMEIDSPAHAGYGWQWGKDAGLGNMVICLGNRPWEDYCLQPPCGQLNPLNNHTYTWLGKIYKDLVSVFPKGEAFHMGGDEVAVRCWNTTDEIVEWMQSNNRSLSESAYLDLWSEFHNRALTVYDDKVGDSNSDIIVWSSGLTDPEIIEKHLDKKRYTVEVWQGDRVSVDLANLGYKVIVAVEDIYYLDHGLRPPTTYHSWKVIYNNKLPMANNSNLILGAETCMFSEFADDFSLDIKVWPRAAALAERLWTDPPTNALAAEYRLLQHRERLISLGIKPDRITPEWCNDREGECIISY
ncbi:chitooligosaccharidolytic beta-N-acetylglucosaminidase-like isoform X2 [Aphis gossypii]|uniref:chitooligosaccharidolytic beta-N-acetylglucosaminidase-like isoform X2 n=1 Tax=Aphis gossypii TaxID=80765 RepID=UPI002159B32A|nr:chitooligosaccharidolytic beta-N-acetylglucosaminidase-like isoform X2 [Aphis gossypii]